MTLEKAHQLIAVQTQAGGGYNRNDVRLILGEMDQLIREFNLQAVFGIRPGDDFSRFGY